MVLHQSFYLQQRKLRNISEDTQMLPQSRYYGFSLSGSKFLSIHLKLCQYDLL